MVAASYVVAHGSREEVENYLYGWNKIVYEAVAENGKGGFVIECPTGTWAECQAGRFGSGFLGGWLAPDYGAAVARAEEMRGVYSREAGGRG